MKFALVCIIALAAVLQAVSADDSSSRSKELLKNLDEILQNDRLVNNYVRCLEEEKDDHCTPDAKDLKKNFRKVVENDCDGCTEEEKSASQKVAKFIYENKPQVWTDLAKKYDPDNKYTAIYKAKYNL